MTPGGHGLLRLGLHRPELRDWAMHDRANSALVTIVIAVFPTYLTSIAATELGLEVATFRHEIATIFSLSVIAGLAPVLGALADYARLIGGLAARIGVKRSSWTCT